MEKIPTIFERDPETKLVIDRPSPECDWVFRGEGKATEMLDGVNIRVTLRDKYIARVEILLAADRLGQFKDTIKPWYVDTDLQDPDNKPLMDAVANAGFWTANNFRGSMSDGEYPCEVMGPDIKGNPLGLDKHIAVPLYCAPGMVTNFKPPRTFDELREFLKDFDSLLSPGHLAEGIVFHHPDGRTAKIKRKDFF